MTRETKSLLIVKQQRLNWSRDKIQRNQERQDIGKEKGEELRVSYKNIKTPVWPRKN